MNFPIEIKDGPPTLSEMINVFEFTQKTDFPSLPPFFEPIVDDLIKDVQNPSDEAIAECAPGTKARYRLLKLREKYLHVTALREMCKYNEETVIQSGPYKQLVKISFTHETLRWDHLVIYILKEGSWTSHKVIDNAWEVLKIFGVLRYMVEESRLTIMRLAIYRCRDWMHKYCIDNYINYNDFVALFGDEYDLKDNLEVYGSWGQIFSNKSASTRDKSIIIHDKSYSITEVNNLIVEMHAYEPYKSRRVLLDDGPSWLLKDGNKFYLSGYRFIPFVEVKALLLIPEDEIDAEILKRNEALKATRPRRRPLKPESGGFSDMIFLENLRRQYDTDYRNYGKEPLDENGKIPFDELDYDEEPRDEENDREDDDL